MLNQVRGRVDSSGTSPNRIVATPAASLVQRGAFSMRSEIAASVGAYTCAPATGAEVSASSTVTFNDGPLVTTGRGGMTAADELCSETESFLDAEMASVRPTRPSP